MLCLFTIYFVEIKLGISLLLAFILMPLITGLTSYLFIKRIKIEASINKNIINKGEEIQLKLNINRRSALPFFYIEILLCDSKILVSDFDKEMIIHPNSDFDENFTLYFRAKNYGRALLGIDKFLVHDFFGLFVYELTIDESMKAKVDILPNIPELLSNELFYKCLEPSKDDNEEEKTSRNFTQRSILGYDYRKYVEGDSLKTINWKLSMKHNEYYVRLNEYLVLSKSQTIILDPTASEKSDASAQERIIEALLGMARFMCLNEVDTNVIFYADKIWQNHSIKKTDDVSALQYRFIDFQFNNEKLKRIPDSLINESNTINYFTDNPDNQLFSDLSKYSSGKNINIIVSRTAEFNSENIYFVNKDFDFVRIE